MAGLLKSARFIQTFPSDSSVLQSVVEGAPSALLPAGIQLSHHRSHSLPNADLHPDGQQQGVLHRPAPESRGSSLRELLLKVS